MLNVYDTGHEWVPELMKAAVARGFPARQIRHESLIKPGTMFFMPNQFPAQALERDLATALDLYLVPNLCWITDTTQLAAYEEKRFQTALWASWMPETCLAYTIQDALDWLDDAEFPIISKSAFGSASLNVRFLANHVAALEELDTVFGPGLLARRGPGPGVRQKGYVIWQKFIPHDFTWRVTIIGDKFQVYKRFNYDDRPMACPSAVKQTEPVPMCEKVESLLEWAKQFFKAAGTKWCAIDVLEEPTGTLSRWRLLETSLAWARGNDPAGNAPFYGTKRSLNTQFDLLIDELERAPW